MVLDADAITRLYRAHAAGMLGFFMRRTFDAEVAVDLVADTFVAAIADRGSFRGESDDEAVGWLYGIARHRLGDFQRHGRVERRGLEQAGLERRALSDWEYERIEELAGLSELREQVAAGLDGLSEQTARARVSRAVAALRRSLPIAVTLNTRVESNDLA